MTDNGEHKKNLDIRLDLDPLGDISADYFAHELHAHKTPNDGWHICEERRESTHPPEWEPIEVERFDGLKFSGVRRGRWVFIVSRLFDGCCLLTDVKRWRVEDRPDFDPFEWRAKLNNRVKSLELDEWRGRYSELHERLINWGRWTRYANSMGVSPIVGIMKDLGYKPEFIDEKTAPIDFRDAEEIQGAYSRLKDGSPEREYLALTYCNGFCSGEQIARALHCPRHLIRELERRSMTAMIEALDRKKVTRWARPYVD